MAYVQGEELPLAFFERPADRVARELLGKVLVSGGGDIPLTAGMVVEVEAYLGSDDPASHAYRGPTPRNRSMFGGGGTCYVYLSYGVNYCMNVVTGDVGLGQAVLLRALEPLIGVEHMARRRGMDPAVLDGMVLHLPSPKARGLSNGPGKLTQAMGIGPDFDGRSFLAPDSGIKLFDAGAKVEGSRIAVSPRIGITKAADLLLRFYLADSKWLSRPHRSFAKPR